MTVALSGILLLQCRSRDRKILVSDFFVALGISTMLGDAFFHIIPHMLGLHDDHDHHDDEIGHFVVRSDDHDDNDENIITAKIATLVGSMYAMWLIGSILKLNGKKGGHSHNIEEDEDGCCGPLPTDNLSEIESKAEIEWGTVGGILISDCMCNCSDGIAMGVSWTTGLSKGVIYFFLIKKNNMKNMVLK